MRWSFVAFFVLFSFGCDGSSETDAGTDSGLLPRIDSGPRRDAGRDSGSGPDTGPRDAGSETRMVALDTMNRLLFIDPEDPTTVIDTIQVTGLLTSEVLHAISVRPIDGGLIGLGSTSRLYRIDTSDGLAASIGVQALAPPLNGAHFGMDFNPVVDRVRIVSDTEQNLRVFPDTGGVAATDSPLTPAGDIAALAYTNSEVGATVTTAYAIDYVEDRLMLLGGIDGVPSPNSGMLTEVGPLEVDVEGTIGFEIDPEDNTAYAAFTVGGAPALYTIDLETGEATMVGAIGTATPIRGLAFVR
jgi:hypothetical protein